MLGAALAAIGGCRGGHCAAISGVAGAASVGARACSRKWACESRARLIGRRCVCVPRRRSAHNTSRPAGGDQIGPARGEQVRPHIERGGPPVECLSRRRRRRPGANLRRMPPRVSCCSRPADCQAAAPNGRAGRQQTHLSPAALAARNDHLRPARRPPLREPHKDRRCCRCCCRCCCAKVPGESASHFDANGWRRISSVANRCARVPARAGHRGGQWPRARRLRHRRQWPSLMAAAAKCLRRRTIRPPGQAADGASQGLTAFGCAAL